MTNTVNKKTNEEEISIIISAEHADYLNEIEECFPGLTIDPCYIRKSRGELPMKIIIFLGGAIMSGLTWDIIKLGIQKVYDKFSKKELDFSIKFENMFFSINKDGRVKAITLDHEQFSHIKTLDDLYVYIQEKTQSKMPNVDWKATTLGEITQMNLESISTNFGYDKILYLDTGSITENKIEQLQTIEIKDAPSRAKRLVKEGDIIYSTVRPNQKHFGFMKNPPKNLVVSTGFTVISPEKDIDGKFIYYYITQNYITEKLHQIAEQAVSAYPSIRPENIKQLPIHLPPLPEQQAIAAVLSSFDDKIELLRAENQTLEQMGQELFKERFGKWKVGDDLPEGWRVGKLGEKNFAEIIGSGIERFDREKIYLATADVINSSIFNSNTKITYQDRPSRANMQPTEKSIWFAKMQDSRKLLMFDDYSQDEIENYILSTGFAGIKTSELSHYYLWCFVLSDDFDMIKNNMANGAVQIAVNNSNLEKIEFLIPNEEFLRKFNEFVKPLFKKIYLNNKQITSLSATCDQLLPKLMSGEVRVEF